MKPLRRDEWAVLARLRLGAAALGVFLSPLSSAFGQIGPRLVDEPWKDEPHYADTVDELFFFERADVEGSRDSARLFFWASRGRIKPERNSTDPVFALGYRIVTLDASSDRSAIDGQLNDVGVSAMARVGELTPGWTLRLIAGMGTANDGHWSDADALYGTATADFEAELGEASSLHLGVAWDGNSPLLPDIPLPYVSYAYRPTDGLKLAVGTRDAVVSWKPLETFELKLEYGFPVDVAAEADCAVIGGVGLFARYERSLSGFTIEGREHRRLFYSQDVVAAGIRWVTYWFDASVGAGWAIDRRFRSGFDLRELEMAGEIESGVFAYIRVQGTFGF